MLKISRLTDYATAIVLFLQKNNTLQSSDYIASAVGLESPTASKVLKLLTKAEILASTRGANGGYKLTKNIENLSLYDVITAIEGNTAITECNKTDSQCIQEKNCETQTGWQQVNQEIKNILLKMTIKRMEELSKSSHANIKLTVKDYV